MVNWEAIGLTALPYIGAIPGGLVVQSSIDSWYNKKLRKPALNPPTPRIFGPETMVLYSSMGYASYIVYRDGGGFNGDAKTALTLYATQLGLNWTWPMLFFGLKSLKWSAVEIVILAGTVAATTWSFYKINPNAGYIMLPYLTGITLSAGYNITLFCLNSNTDEEEEPKEK